ncbi:MAG: DUF3379 family protein [Pseudomonadota bacterium]
MNFDEFERAILADPTSESPELLERESECPRSAALRQQALELEQRLQRAFDVPVPDSLKQPIPDMAALAAAAQGSSNDTSSNVVELPARTANRWQLPAWVGLAACLALVAGLVLRQTEIAEDPTLGATNPLVAAVPADAQTDALIAEMIEALGPEITSSMVQTDLRVSTEQVSQVLSPVGALMDVAPGPISYAKSCVVNGELVPHLVVQTENGPVTILVMPNVMVDGPKSIMRGGYEGVILPAGEGGSVAIIGRDKESVEAVRASSGESLGFSI